MELDGYYRVFYNTWYEDENNKDGWVSDNWGEPSDFELVEVLEYNKFAKPIKGLFRYTGPVYLGKQQAAHNIQTSLLFDFMEYVEKYPKLNPVDIKEKEPYFNKLNIAISVLEDKFKIKDYINL